MGYLKPEILGEPIRAGLTPVLRGLSSQVLRWYVQNYSRLFSSYFTCVNERFSLEPLKIHLQYLHWTSRNVFPIFTRVGLHPNNLHIRVLRINTDSLTYQSHFPIGLFD